MYLKYTIDGIAIMTNQQMLFTRNVSILFLVPSSQLYKKFKY